MENSRDRFRTELTIDFAQYLFEVNDEMRHVVTGATVQRILTVIAHIEKNQIVAIAQQIPEWQIRIDGEAVAMA